MNGTTTLQHKNAGQKLPALRSHTNMLDRAHTYTTLQAGRQAAVGSIPACKPSTQHDGGGGKLQTPAGGRGSDEAAAVHPPDEQLGLVVEHALVGQAHEPVCFRLR